jgi:hypothetical protein
MKTIPIVIEIAVVGLLVAAASFGQNPCACGGKTASLGC